jgi:hypothetical protein
MDEFFEVSFRYFRALLNVDEQKGIPSDVFKYVNAGELSSFSSRFCLVGDVYGNNKLLILNLFEHLLTRSHMFFEFTSVHYDTYLGYLSQQDSHINLKFKELFLEVVGEYSKLLLRAKEMEDVATTGYYKKVSKTVFHNLWNRFHFTLSCLLRKLSLPSRSDESPVHMFGFEECNSEWNLVIQSSAELKKLFYHPSSQLLSFLPLLMIKFSLNEKKNTFPVVISVAESREELGQLFRKIESFYACAPPAPRTELEVTIASVIRVPGYFKNVGYLVDSVLWNMMMSYYYRAVLSVGYNSSVDYLSLLYHVQHSTVLYNDYLYICLEEYASLRSDSHQARDTSSVFNLLDQIKVRVIVIYCVLFSL